MSEAQNHAWALETGSLRETVLAPTALEAMDTLRHYPIEDFGLVVIATPNGDEDKMEIASTGRLLESWGRVEDAALALEAARREGYLT